MSLTAQQNRYRQGQLQGQIQAPVRQFAPQQTAPQQAMPIQRPMFRPMLDASSAPQQQTSEQPSAAQSQKQTARRVTGPRRTVAPAQAPVQYQGQIPQQQAPYASNQAWQNQVPQQTRQQAPQNVAEARGSSVPPVGQLIAPPQPAIRPQASTPSSRLAQFAAQSQGEAQPILTNGPVALNPKQARKSLFGSLNDDLITPAPASAASDLTTATAIPTVPVSQQELGDVLAGGN